MLASCSLPALCAGAAAYGAQAGAVLQSPVQIAAAPQARIAIGHDAVTIPASSRPLGAVGAAEPVSAAVSLPLRNRSQLKDLLHGLYDPADARYHKFLTPGQFAAEFGPTQADYDAVTAYAKAQGLQVTGTYSNRALIDVAGPAAAVEAAFGVNLAKYQRADGSTFHVPDRAPSLPANVGVIVSGVVGLDNSRRANPNAHQATPGALALAGALHPLATASPGITRGSDPFGFFTPSDTKTAYNIPNISQPGKGQTLGLFELDGYDPSDIRSYCNEFGFPAPTLENVLVNGFDGSETSDGGAFEVTLDIECMTALAPYNSKIIVYEAPNDLGGVAACYTKIATDNRATTISSSWGIAEDFDVPSFMDMENTAFEQMAAQGQSMFVASGDGGAYEDTISVSAQDPSTQPYVTGVGGTDLSVVAPGGAYQSETSWGDPNDTTSRGPHGTGSGGGISVIWPIPDYQKGAVSGASLGSQTMRNVPDVSLFGDFDTGFYSTVFRGGMSGGNGTSAAAPLWAAFAALANQQRGVGSGGTPVGFLNPTLYTLAQGPRYALDFHDVNDGSTNLFYPAVTGYDLSTGWGSFNGANLLKDLVGSMLLSLSSATTGKVTIQWPAYTGATSYNVYRATVQGGEGTRPIATGVTTTTFTDTTVTDGTTYYYEVTPVVSGTENAKSSEIAALPLDAPARPTPTLQSNAVHLAWSAVKSASAYRVYRGTSAASLSVVADSVSGATFDDTTVATGSTYYYAVTALGPIANEESARSSTASATVEGPSAPTGLTVQPLSNAVSLAWNASANATLYNVKRASMASGPFTIIARPASTRYTDTDAANGTTYYYEVSAVNPIAEGGNSAVVSATPSAQYSAPPAPTGLKATAATGSVTVTWTAAPRATSYTVKRATRSSGVYAAVGTTTTASYADTKAVAGTLYYYEVTAANSYGTSPASGYIGVVAK